MRTRLERILCVTDLSPYSNQALPYAAKLASAFGAKLFVGHVIDPQSRGTFDLSKYTPPVMPEDLAREAEAEMRRAMARESGDWEPLILEGRPDAAIVAAAERMRADLLVCASHGHSGMKRLVLGSVAEKLLRTAPCPILVVRGLEERDVPASSAEMQLRRILIGCDFSPDSKRAVDFGISLAEELQVELHLLHVMEPILYRTLDRMTETLAAQLDQAVKDAVERELLKAVPEEARNWCEVTTALRSGTPGEEIAAYAGIHVVSLIVVGARGRNLIGRLFFGSTADRLVRSAPCPVLIVRAPAGPEERSAAG